MPDIRPNNLHARPAADDNDSAAARAQQQHAIRQARIARFDQIAATGDRANNGPPAQLRRPPSPDFDEIAHQQDPQAATEAARQLRHHLERGDGNAAVAFVQPLANDDAGFMGTR